MKYRYNKRAELWKFYIPGHAFISIFKGEILVATYLYDCNDDIGLEISTNLTDRRIKTEIYDKRYQTCRKMLQKLT